MAHFKGKDDLPTAYFGWSIATGAIVLTTLSIVINVAMFVLSIVYFTKGYRLTPLMSAIIGVMPSIVSAFLVFSRSADLARVVWLICIPSLYMFLLSFAVFVLLSLYVVGTTASAKVPWVLYSLGMIFGCISAVLQFFLISIFRSLWKIFEADGSGFEKKNYKEIYAEKQLDMFAIPVEPFDEANKTCNQVDVKDDAKGSGSPLNCEL